MAEYVELYMDQGADFSTTIFINNESNNTPQDLHGYVITGQLRKSLVSENATSSFVCTIPDPSLGEILIELAASNTANIVAGTYFFDIKTIDTLNANLTNRLIEGVVFVQPGITR